MGDGVEGTLLGLNLVPKIMGAALFWSLQPYIYIACTALLSRVLGVRPHEGQVLLRDSPTTPQWDDAT